MEVAARLAELGAMHPRLLWDEIVASTAAVLGDGAAPPWALVSEVNSLPGCKDGPLRLMIDPAGVPMDRIARVRRTYDPARLVELSAIGVAGLLLHYGGGHVLQDIALRGTGADYLVDDSHYVLEIAGRSRRADFGAAWEQRIRRLESQGRGYYLCVVEFETPAARLAFHE
jgi:hypothetical protein